MSEKRPLNKCDEFILLILYVHAENRPSAYSHLFHNICMRQRWARAFKRNLCSHSHWIFQIFMNNSDVIFNFSFISFLSRLLRLILGNKATLIFSFLSLPQIMNATVFQQIVIQLLLRRFTQVSGETEKKRTQI